MSLRSSSPVLEVAFKAFSLSQSQSQSLSHSHKKEEKREKKGMRQCPPPPRPLSHPTYCWSHALSEHSH